MQYTQRPTRFSTESLYYTALKLENLVLGVAKLLQDTRKLTLVLGADLATGDGLVQTRWATDEELDVLLLGLREHSLQQLLGDVTLATSPLLGRVVQDVEGTETLGVGVLQILELLLEENVVLVHVTEDQSHLGAVLGVLEDLTGQLVHRGDTGTTGDQADVVVLVGLPGVLDDGTLERQALVDIHGVDVFRHRAVGVSLDDQLEVARNV